MNYYQEIEEMFALPINLKVETTISGMKLYSSRKLKDKFLKTLSIASRTQAVYKQLEHMVNVSKLLVPCYLSKGLLNFFVRKMFSGPESKGILGFYHLKEKKVFILIDNSINPIGTAKDDFIASTTIHECVHLYADRMRSSFLKLFKEELYRYYASYFGNVYELKKSPRLSEFMKYVLYFEYNRSRSSMNKQLFKYYDILYKEFKGNSKLSDEQIKELLLRTTYLIKLSILDMNTFIRQFRNNLNILRPLSQSYVYAFGERNTVSTSYQELFSLSEVICILSELKPGYSKIKRMFRDMA